MGVSCGCVRTGTGLDVGAWLTIPTKSEPRLGSTQQAYRSGRNAWCKNLNKLEWRGVVRAFWTMCGGIIGGDDRENCAAGGRAVFRMGYEEIAGGCIGADERGTRSGFGAVSPECGGDAEPLFFVGAAVGGFAHCAHAAGAVSVGAFGAAGGPFD